MRQDIAEKLVSFYRDDVEGYIRNAGRTFLKIHAGANFTGYQDIKIRIGDVARYYAHVGGLRGHIFRCHYFPFLFAPFEHPLTFHISTQRIAQSAWRTGHSVKILS